MTTATPHVDESPVPAAPVGLFERVGDVSALAVLRIVLGIVVVALNLMTRQ